MSLTLELLGNTLAAAAGARGRRSSAGSVVDIGTRVGIQDVVRLDSRAAVADVSKKGAGAAREGIGGRKKLQLFVASCKSRRDGDVGAVHVQLAVSEVVVPREGKQRTAGGRVVGQGEAPGGRERALPNVRVQDGPGAAAVVRQGDLARASVVGGGAGEGPVVRLAGLPGDDRLTLAGAEQRVVSLAGEVAAGLGQRVCHAVVDVGGEAVVAGAEWGRPDHLHVRLGNGGEAEDGGDKD